MIVNRILKVGTLANHIKDFKQSTNNLGEKFKSEFSFADGKSYSNRANQPQQSLTFNIIVRRGVQRFVFHFFQRVQSSMATAVAGCSVPAVPTGPLTTPEHRNWLALGHALTTVLCEGLRPFVNRETEAFYRNVTAAVAAIPGARPCTCV